MSLMFSPAISSSALCLQTSDLRPHLVAPFKQYENDFAPLREFSTSWNYVALLCLHRL